MKRVTIKKRCSKCGHKKAITDFHEHPGYKLGVKSRCKQCDYEEATSWKKKNADKWWGYQLKHKFGITLEQYNAMLKAQDNKCLICLSPSKDGQRLCVDHNHTTGEIRGLLCRPCNAAIGLLGDCPDVLKRAAQYLTKKS